MLGAGTHKYLCFSGEQAPPLPDRQPFIQKEKELWDARQLGLIVYRAAHVAEGPGVEPAQAPAF